MLLAPVAPTVLNYSIPPEGGLSIGVVVNAKTNYVQDYADAAAPAAADTSNAP